MAGDGKEAVGLEESILIGVISGSLSITASVTSKAWEFGIGRPAFEICISYYMCYFGLSYLSSLILSLPRKMDIVFPLTVF